MRPIIPVLLLSLCLCACVNMGFSNPFVSDPLTGGVDTSRSTLLDAPGPAGMQYYPQHSFSATGSAREGMETWRGRINVSAVAQSMFNTLKGMGWQLRFCERKGDRAIYLYQRNSEYTALVFHRQGMLSILEIWLGPVLPDGAQLPYYHEGQENRDSASQTENYDAQDGSYGQSMTGDSWNTGSTNVQEREL